MEKNLKNLENLENSEGFVLGPQYRDSCRHYVNENTLEVVSYNLFKSRNRIRTHYKSSILNDYFSKKDVLKIPIFINAFKSVFPDVDIRNVSKCRRQYSGYYHGTPYQKFCYLNDITRDIYYLKKIEPIEWDLLTDLDKVDYIIREHFETDKERKDREDENKRLEKVEEDKKKKELEPIRESFYQYLKDNYGYDKKNIMCNRSMVDDPVIFKYYHPTEEYVRLENKYKKIYEKNSNNMYGSTSCYKEKCKGKYHYYSITQGNDFLIGVDIPPGVKLVKLMLNENDTPLPSDISKFFLPIKYLSYTNVVLVCESDRPDPIVKARFKNIYVKHNQRGNLMEFLYCKNLYVPYQNGFIICIDGMAMYINKKS